MKDISTALRQIADDYDGNPAQLLVGIGTLLQLAEQQYSDTGIGLLTSDFLSALQRYRSGENWTFDKALGLSEVRKGKDQANHRFLYSNAYEIYCDVQALIDNGGSTSATRNSTSVFQQVSDKYPRGESSIKAIYYNVKKFLKNLE